MNQARLLAHVALAAAALTSSAGCVVLRRPTTLPPADKPYVAVLSGEMPEPITMVARHAWIIVNVADQGRSLLRYELLSRAFKETTSRPLDYFGEGDVALHGLVEKDRGSIRKIVECLDEETPRYNEEHPDYFPMPGPNSNTYVDQMLRRCNIPVDLPSTAIGKDYRGPIGVSLTSGGTGVQFDTWIAGVKLGLTEGVELHVLGLTIGVDWWPPALILPVNPGRLGFDDR
ncbi:DUF3750 domain-containing protein [Polyangium jinanense]|uniref:DUF3750 domain-containing protein n=1 Tax=Polyangium jinanense TaxID=2829994 RepID=UPI002340378B|nr:DUF3750 domain-containing protein [Polyangium jinanense]MDC3962448.1 DUF3750 domain-containing protein [Polyangium jinanense]